MPSEFERREHYRQLSLVAYVVMLALLVPLTIFVVRHDTSVRSEASKSQIATNQLAGKDNKSGDEKNASANPSFFPLAPCPTCDSPSEAPISGTQTVPSVIQNPDNPVDNANPMDMPCKKGDDDGGDDGGDDDGDEEGDKDKGHGNDDDGVDDDNPGQGMGGPNEEKNDDDENDDNESAVPSGSAEPSPQTASLAKDNDKGHGNDKDGEDEDNPSKGKGGPNAEKDDEDDEDDEDEDDKDEDDDEDDEDDGDEKGKKGKHWKPDGGVSDGLGDLLKQLIDLLNQLLKSVGGGQINLPDMDGGGDDEDDNDGGDDNLPPCPEDNPANGGNNPVDNPGNTPSGTPSDVSPVPSSAAPSSAPSGTPSGAPSGAPAPSGAISQVPVGKTVVFDGSFDSGGLSSYGTCQWNGANGKCPAQGTKPMAALVSDGPGHETAARFEIQPGHMAAEGNRTEARAPNAADVKEGDERWYQFQLKFDQTFKNPTGGWFIVMQWHAGSGSPPLAVEVNNSGALELTSSAGNKTIPIGPIKKGQWVEYVIHAKFSKNASTGFVEVWENGVQKVKKTPMANMTSASNYLKLGIYRDDKDTGNNVVYHDGLKITAP